MRKASGEALQKGAKLYYTLVNSPCGNLVTAFIVYFCVKVSDESSVCLPG